MPVNLPAQSPVFCACLSPRRRLGYLRMNSQSPSECQACGYARWERLLLSGSERQTICGGQEPGVSTSCRSADPRRTIWGLSFLLRSILTLDPNQLATYASSEQQPQGWQPSRCSVPSLPCQSQNTNPRHKAFSPTPISAISPHPRTPPIHKASQHPPSDCGLGYPTHFNLELSWGNTETWCEKRKQ